MRGLLLALCLIGNPVVAEQAEYGAVWLSGLGRDSWPLNPAGPSQAMVCNVNGPDGFLSIRSGPGTDYAQNRALKRLATITVDTSDRRGRWVRVLDAYRDVSPEGKPQNYVSLSVTGWAHDGYLCDFIY